MTHDKQYREAVAARAAKLMAQDAEYDPLHGDHLCEAIGEIPIEKWESMCALLRDGKYVTFSMELAACADSYWQKQAEVEVGKQIEKEIAEGREE